MTTATLPSPQRKVVLRLSSNSHDTAPMPASLDADELKALIDRARSLGLPLHHDPQIAALLISLRMNKDVPVLLYAAAAAVLSTIYEAAGEP